MLFLVGKKQRAHFCGTNRVKTVLQVGSLYSVRQIFQTSIKNLLLSLGRALSNQVIFLFVGYFSANHPFPSFRRDSEHVRIQKSKSC